MVYLQPFDVLGKLNLNFNCLILKFTFYVLKYFDFILINSSGSEKQSTLLHTNENTGEKTSIYSHFLN